MLISPRITDSKPAGVRYILCKPEICLSFACSLLCGEELPSRDLRPQGWPRADASLVWQRLTLPPQKPRRPFRGHQAPRTACAAVRWQRRRPRSCAKALAGAGERKIKQSPTRSSLSLQACRQRRTRWCALEQHLSIPKPAERGAKQAALCQLPASVARVFPSATCTF